MKRKSLIAVFLIFVFSFILILTSCKKCSKNKTPVGGGITPPILEQWEKVGIDGDFKPNVNGELVISAFENNEITMKWTGSDEGSLDNTIAWLKEQGFTTYGGQTAQKTSEEGGKIKVYTAEKVIGNAKTLSSNIDKGYTLTPLAITSYNKESKTMVAECAYIVEDFTIMGQSFNEGELYLDIYEKVMQNQTSSLLTNWPKSQIEGIIGESIPEYEGTSEGYQFVDTSLGANKNVQINVFGASETDASIYKTQLTQNGYVLNDDVYDRILSNGDKIQILIYAMQTYHPDTFELVNVVNITIMFEKNSGEYNSWSSLNISVFNEAGIPAYNGGTSFDLEDIGKETIASEKAAVEQVIETLEMYESMLDDEQKAELEALRAMLPYFDDIECYMITIYGTNSSQVKAYEDSLTNAGFSSGVKKTTSYEFEVNIDEDGATATITIIRTPLELIEGSNNNGNVGTTKKSKLPTNIKIIYNDGIYDITAIKIDENYVVQKNAYGYCDYIYYKKNGSGWNVYRKEMFDSKWNLDEEQETDIEWLESNVFDFILDDVEGNKIGTDTLLGKSVEVYLDEFSYGSYSYSYTYYRDIEMGLVLKVVMTTSAGTTTYVVNSIDTNVSSFDEIELP